MPEAEDVTVPVVDRPVASGAHGSAPRGGVRRVVVALGLAAGLCVNATAAGAAAPSTAHGTIAGRLGYEGGAYPGGFHPTAGVVRFAGPHKVAPIRVPKSGDFRVRVAPGHYRLTGCSGTKDRQCGPPGKVAVTAHQTSRVRVVWLLAP